MTAKVNNQYYMSVKEGHFGGELNSAGYFSTEFKIISDNSNYDMNTLKIIYYEE